MCFGLEQYEVLNINHIKSHFHSRFLSLMTLSGMDSFFSSKKRTFAFPKVDTNVTFREWPCLMEMTTLSSWSKSEKDCSMLLYISWEQH